MALDDFNEKEWEEQKGGDLLTLGPEKPKFRGVFLDKKENQGDENNSTIYNFTMDDGSIVGFWGSTVLDTKLRRVQEGDEVKIEYVGEVESQKKKGRKYKDFKVWIRKSLEIRGN